MLFHHYPLAEMACGDALDDFPPHSLMSLPVYLALANTSVCHQHPIHEAYEHLRATWSLSNNCRAYYAMRDQNLSMISYSIHQGVTSWNYALRGAYTANNRDLIDFCIAMGGKHKRYVLVGPMNSGCRELVGNVLIHAMTPIVNDVVWTCSGGSGDLSMVKMLADDDTTEPKWKRVCTGALMNGHHAIANDLMDVHGFEPEECVEIFYKVVGVGRLQGAKLLLQRGVDGVCDWNEALEYACKSGRFALIRLCEENGADNWSKALAGAYESGRRDVIAYVLEKCSASERANVEVQINTFSSALVSGDTELVTATIPSSLPRYRPKCVELIMSAALTGNMEILQLVISLIDYDVISLKDTVSNALMAACVLGHEDICRWCIDQGATACYTCMWSCASEANHY